MEGFFIDKLCVTQDHLPVDGEMLPVVGQFKNFRVDLKTGESAETVSYLKLEGSFSSSLIIRSNGYRVEVYGNPSRWQRIDNLYGLKTIDECIAVYNHILLGLGLPVFTKCTQYLYLASTTGKPNKTANGAIIKHIDFTRNLAVGLGNERAYNKALSTQSIGRSVPPFLYPDENTVEWYGANMQKMSGSTFRYIKVYTKTADLLRNQKKLCKGVNEQDFQYFEDLLQFTVRNGVIREEHSFKREYLKKHNETMYKDLINKLELRK